MKKQIKEVLQSGLYRGKELLNVNNAQDVLEEYYPKQGKSKSKGFNYGKRREEIKSLNISDQNLKGSLTFDES